MAALEAMSMGIPVIASDNRGTREYMKDGCNGYVCDVKNPEDFADAFERICRMQPGKRAAMQSEGCRTAEKFDIKNASVVMSRVYEAVDAQNTPATETATTIHYLPPQNGSMRKVQ